MGFPDGKEFLNVIYKPIKIMGVGYIFFIFVNAIAVHEFAQDHSGEYPVEYLKYWTGNGAIKLDDFSYCPSDYLNKINFRIMSRMIQLETFNLSFSCSLIKIRP